MSEIARDYKDNFNHSIDVMFRNAIKSITRTPRGTANEPVEMELGIRKADL